MKRYRLKIDGRYWIAEVQSRAYAKPVLVHLYREDRPQDRGIPFDRSSYVAKQVASKVGA